MTVYFIRRVNDPLRLIKIGFTRGKVEGRIRTLTTGVPGGFEVLATIDGGKSVEQAIHAALIRRRVEGEWFEPHQEVFAAIEEAKTGKFFVQEPAKPDKMPLPVPSDETSPNIVMVSRFYLNELVKREWRGMGDTVEGARDRVMVRLNLNPSQGDRLWNKASAMRDVTGETYRCLWLAYAEAVEAEGTISEALASSLRSYRNFRSKTAA